MDLREGGENAGSGNYLGKCAMYLYSRVFKRSLII